MTTGEKIREFRLKAGLTQTELAKKLGIPYQSIGQWERGLRSPKYETLVKIASALDVFITELVGEGTVSDVYFESDAERIAYQTNSKIKSTGAVILGKYVNDSYQMWIKFKDGIVMSLNANDLQNLEQRIDHFTAFFLDEFEHSKQDKDVQLLPDEAILPGKH